MTLFVRTSQAKSAFLRRYYNPALVSMVYLSLAFLLLDLLGKVGAGELYASSL